MDHPIDRKKLSVNLAPDVAEAVRFLADKKGVSISQVVRDAMFAEEGELSANPFEDGMVLYVDSDGNLKEMKV